MRSLPRLGTAILSLCLIATSAHAARLLGNGPQSDEVIVSQSPQHPFIRYDRICFYRGENEVACGNVVSASRRQAVVQVDSRKDIVREKKRDAGQESFVELNFEKARLRMSDRVALVSHEDPPPDESVSEEVISGLEKLEADDKSKEPRSISGKEDLLTEMDPSIQETQNGSDRHANITGGLMNLFPEVQYQTAINNHFAPGFIAMYMNSSMGNGMVKGFGMYGTATYYDKEPFQGWWAQAGLGILSLKGNADATPVSFSSLAVLTNAGWRWKWSSGWNVGVGAGFQFLTNSHPANSSLSFSSVLPTLNVDVGFNF